MGMELGFLIDHRKCIGCHACTVACKAENEVPLGDFRTWVKYVEKGAYPDTRRHFTVLRCNHCDAAPCVEICPVAALHKRPDAIVDLDRDLCIGCRACMQACPYDALYLNEDRGVAEKCHFCAHRAEVGLEPACVIVCPERAIVAGDTTDPDSEISVLIREIPNSRRKPEKGTEPRVWYVDAAAEGLVGGATTEPERWVWSDRREPPGPVVPGFEPTPDIVTTLNVSHPPAWGSHIWTYVLTKNVAAGAMIAAPFLSLLGVKEGPVVRLLPEVLALVFLAVTNVLLVHDLASPGRFLKILTHPNPRSWLTRGGWVLGAFGLVTTAALVARVAGRDGMADVLRWVDLPLAALTAGYSAWLFHQCRGRDLWLEKGLFVHLALRAAGIGAGIAFLLPHESRGLLLLNGHVFALLALANAAWIAVNLTRPPETADGAKAHAILNRGRQPQVAMGLIAFSAVIAMSAIGIGGAAAQILGALALLVAGAGDFIYERAWIQAGQAVPLS
jgi:Fe-S-cluster-containing dehydrogenase component